MFGGYTIQWSYGYGRQAMPPTSTIHIMTRFSTEWSPGVKHGEAWNPLKSRCFLFAWTFSDRGSPIVIHRGWEVLTQNNFCTRKTYWLDGDLSGFPLPFLESFHRVVCCFTSQADYVELEQLKIQVSQGEGDQGNFSHLGHWVDCICCSHFGPLLYTNYILTTMGLQVGFLGNTNFLDVKNVCCFFFSVDPMPNCRRDHFFSGYGAGDGWLWSLPNPI